MKFRVIMLAFLLPLTGVSVASPASALAPTGAVTVSKVCASTYSFSFNLSAAAKVLVPNGTQPAQPAGMGSAQALADQVMASARANPCDEPVGDAAQSAINDAKDSVDSGDRAGAREILIDFLNGLEYVNRSRVSTARTSSTCEGFTNHDLKLPEEARSALAVAQEAQALGADDIASQAMTKAVAITTDWANSGAGNQATSVSDWLGIAAKLQLIGADEASSNAAISHMNQAAKEAYNNYNTSECRANAASINCFLKAAQFLAMTGNEPASFSGDVNYQLKTARSLKQGKVKKCPVEKYIFRLNGHSDGGDGVISNFDTGQVTFTVKNHRITSDSIGPLVISSGRTTCWVKDDETWVRGGVGTAKGGTFPYKVAGVDDGDVLHLRLLQNATVSVSMGGSQECRAFAQLGVGFVDTFFKGLDTSGLELPPGGKDIDQTETTYGVFEPTGETTVDSYHVLLKMIYPTRS